METAKKYVGYHPEETLPFKQGDMVKVPKGTTIRSTHPSRKEFVAGRTYRVKVNHLLPGRSDQPDLYDPGLIHHEPPMVCWVGTGSYWFWADINDLEKVA